MIIIKESEVNLMDNCGPFWTNTVNFFCSVTSMDGVEWDEKNAEKVNGLLESIMTVMSGFCWETDTFVLSM